MNSNNRNSNLLIFFLLTCFYNNIKTITINNKPIQPNEICIYTPEHRHNFVTLELKNGNIHIESENIKRTKEKHSRETATNRSFLDLFETELRIFSSDDGKNMITKEKIMLKAQKSVDLVNHLLNTEKAIFLNNDIESNDSFFVGSEELSCQTPLIIEHKSDESQPLPSKQDYINILITFNNNPTNPMIINGHIDLISTQMPDFLFLTNVKEIKIVFSSET